MTLSRAFPKERIDTGSHDVAPSADDADRFVRLAEIGDGWLHPDSSNYTFVVELRLEGKTGFGVYKPQAGEAPLWDFPAGTLYRRECAAYDLSCLLQWPIVPPTVYRDSELGVGSLQLYVPPVGGSNFFTLRESHPDELFRMAVFDVIANNADRKGGHCFMAGDAGIWGVDHGLTFNVDHKLRTVIWDFAGQRVPDELLVGLCCASEQLAGGGPGPAACLAERLSPGELAKLRARIDALIERPEMPSPYSRRDLPWPWL